MPASGTARAQPLWTRLHAGRWYLAAFDHLRDDLRTFRVDRMRAIALLHAATEPAPEGFDAAEHVSASLAAVPWGHEVEVVLDLPLEEAKRRLPSTLATLVRPTRHAAPDAGGLLEWMAGVLAGLGCSFEIPPGRATAARQRARPATSRSGPAAAIAARRRGSRP
jgi:predicted DNA-binding transcriptional regulator YafY